MKTNKNIERLKGAVVGVILILILTATAPALARVAQETITVNFNNIRFAVNGQVVQTEQEAFIFQGRTYLPVRDVAEALGLEVTWENATNIVHLTSRTSQNVVPNYPPHNPPSTPPQTHSPGHGSSSNRHGSRPTNPTISLQRAIEIAQNDLAQRGIDATFLKDSGMDFERGQWVWELEFRVTGPQGRHGIIEYYINIDNGDIVKFEWDD